MTQTRRPARHIYDLEVTDGGGLTVNVNLGNIDEQGNVTNFTGVSAQVVTDATTNYVEIISGSVSINTTGFTEGSVRLAEVVTAAGSVSSITDRRVLFTSAGAAEANTVTVGPKKEYTTIQGAINSITTASISNVFIVDIEPGTYTENLTLKDWVFLKGRSQSSKLSGKITHGGSATVEIDNLFIETSDDFAVNMNGAADTCTLKITRSLMNCDWSGDASQFQGVCSLTRGQFVCYGNDLNMVKTTSDATADQQNTVFYVSGAEKVELDSFNCIQNILTQDLNADVSLLHSRNTDVESKMFVKDGFCTILLQSTGLHANIVTTFEMEAAQHRSTCSGNLVRWEAVNATAAGLKFLGAQTTNSGVSTATMFISDNRFLWEGAGITDSDIFLGSSTHANDRMYMGDNIFFTTADVIPTRDTAVGSSGLMEFLVTNGQGSQQASGGYTSSGSLTVNSDFTGSNIAQFIGDSLTTAQLARFSSNSADTSTRNLVEIVNDNTAATGTVPFRVQQDAVVNTNFKKVISIDNIIQFKSDGTTPEGNLSGALGDVCFNGPNGFMYRCQGGTTWQKLTPTTNDYAFASDGTTQTIAVATTWQAVTFDSNTTLDGWTHTATTSPFTCPENGIYHFTVNTSIEKTVGAGGVTGGIRATFNGAIIAGSPMGTTVGGTNALRNMSTSGIFTGVSGQDFQIEIVGSTVNVQITTGFAGAESINLTITRIQ